MSVDIKVPVLPESVADATIVTWHKKAGEKVSRDENLVDIETDKVVLEVVSPSDGILDEILKQEGDIVGGQEVIATLNDKLSAAPAKKTTAAKKDAAADKKEKTATKRSFVESLGLGRDSSDNDNDDDHTDLDAENVTNDADAELDNKSEQKSAKTNTVRDKDFSDLTPALRRMLNEKGIDKSKIVGSGKDGKVTKSDVEKHLQGVIKSESSKQATNKGGSVESSKKQSKEASAKTKSDNEAQSTTQKSAGLDLSFEDGDRIEKRVPMSRLRARIAERLVEAQQTAAILTTFNEINMQPVMDLRAKYKDNFEKQYGVRLGFMSFFTHAVTEALKKFPAVNASIDGNDIVYHGYFDIGIAVSTPRGLVVPIIRDADSLSMAEIEKQIADFGSRAQTGSLSIEEITGGTFTISNGGVFGSLMATPILNPPQSGILGMHKIEKRPVVIDDEIVIRPMMYVALSYDHRIIDGKESVQFLATVKEMLEDPSRLLLGV